jgi:hypothetical protein
VVLEALGVLESLEAQRECQAKYFENWAVAALDRVRIYEKLVR